MTAWLVRTWPLGICKHPMVKGVTWHFFILTLNEGRKHGFPLRPGEGMRVCVWGAGQGRGGLL